MRAIIIIFFTICLCSCENTEEKVEKFSAYYDVDSLIDAQLSIFSSEKIKIKKIAVLDESGDSSFYKIDSLQLAQELNAFRKANINKPALDQQYKKIEDEDNDMRVVKYIPVGENSDMEVQLLNLSYKNNQLVNLEALIAEKHWLYDSRRHLNLYFTSGNDSSVINRFVIEGTQKMILRDRVNFKIEGYIFDDVASFN